MKYRTFSKGFKRQLVEEILSGVATPAALCRKHNIARPVLSRWQKQYAKGKFDNEPIAEAVLQERVQQLERMVGRLTMDNDLLKKALRHTLSQQEKSDSLLPTTYPLSEVSKGGAK
ncbi:MAG: transposase [Candidatus Contubernalis sp.]|nr:transposase [Candidatus Contubernalis sp.]